MKKVICVIIVILFFTGCAKIGGHNSGTVYDDRDNSYADETNYPSETRGYPTSEELKAKYPDKEILTWIVPYYFKSHTIESVCLLNELLVKQGADFVVEFKIMESDFFYENGVFYPRFAENVMSYIDNGGQADIITTEVFGQSGNSGNAPVFTLVKKGYLENLKDFMNTVEGAEIYNSYPSIYWKATEVEHNLYGMPMGYVTGGGVYNYYDKALADKYGLDMETMSLPPYEMEEIYKRIYQEETKSNPNFKILQHTSVDKYDLLRDNFFFTRTISTKYDDYGIYNIFENAKIMEIIEIMTGYVKSNFCLESAGWGDLLIARVNSMEYYKDTMLPHDDYYEVFSSARPMQNIISQVCISSSAEHKELAFNLLYRLQTNAELCKIMTNYTEDSYFSEIISDYSSVCNIILCLPEKNGKTAKEIIFESSKELYENDLLGFYIDYTELYEIIKVENDIWNSEYWMINEGNYKVNNDFYDTAATLSADLKAAGIDELTEELNRQYHEWKAGG